MFSSSTSFNLTPFVLRPNIMYYLSKLCICICVFHVSRLRSHSLQYLASREWLTLKRMGYESFQSLTVLVHTLYFQVYPYLLDKWYFNLSCICIGWIAYMFSPLEIYQSNIIHPFSLTWLQKSVQIFYRIQVSLWLGMGWKGLATYHLCNYSSLGRTTVICSSCCVTFLL